MSTPLIMFSRDQCELCEQAAEMASMAAVDWVYQDIRKDIELLRRYRTSIPVLMNQATGEELFWPFEEKDIIDLAAARP